MLSTYTLNDWPDQDDLAQVQSFNEEIYFEGTVAEAREVLELHYLTQFMVSVWDAETGEWIGLAS